MQDQKLEYIKADIRAREIEYDERNMFKSYLEFDDPAINAIVLKHGRYCLPALKARLEESREDGWSGEGTHKSSPWYLLMVVDRLIKYPVPEESHGRLVDLVDLAINAIQQEIEKPNET